MEEPAGETPICAVPAVLPPVTVKLPVVCPALMTAEPETVAAAALSVEGVSVAPLVGAGSLSVMVPPKLRPAPISGWNSVTLPPRAFTVRPEEPLTNPADDPVMVAIPVPLPVVTVNDTSCVPLSTVTLPGTVAAAVLSEPGVPEIPAVPAGTLVCTEPPTVANVREVEEFRLIVMLWPLAAVMVTGFGPLSRTLSLTISCAMYVPLTSATKLGCAEVALVSEAVLPGGIEVSDHEYVRHWLSLYGE